MLSDKSAIIAYERYVLGAIYTAPESFPVVHRIARPEYFNTPEHRLLYEAFITLQKKTLEYQAILEYFQKYHKGKTISDPAYLATLLRDISIGYTCSRWRIKNLLSRTEQTEFQDNVC